MGMTGSIMRTLRSYVAIRQGSIKKSNISKRKRMFQGNSQRYRRSIALRMLHVGAMYLNSLSKTWPRDDVRWCCSTVICARLPQLPFIALAGKRSIQTRVDERES